MKHVYAARNRMPGLLRCLLLALLLAGCATGNEGGRAGPDDASGLTLPAGFRAEVYARGLRSPTALAWGPDGKLYLTQLGGGENAGVGQVLVLDQPGAAPRVLLEGLLKPTGLVWRERDLFVVAGRDVLRSRLDDLGRLTTPEPLVRDLPYNTRSEGQIELLPDGRLLFEASGDLRDTQSGRLLTLLPGEAPRVLATGLKNAYAHTIDPGSGRLFTTEIGDDPVDGGAPPEEINIVEPGADYGWPRCYGAQLPVRSRGADARLCASTQPPLITLPPHTTPTGLTFYHGTDFPPGYRDALYVALWNGAPPRVLRVTLSEQDGQITGQAEPFVDGLERPIDLLPDPAGGLLVLDEASGMVYRVQSSQPSSTP